MNIERFFYVNKVSRLTIGYANKRRQVERVRLIEVTPVIKCLDN